MSNAEFLQALFPPLETHEVFWWTYFAGDHKTQGRWAGRKAKDPSEVLDPTDHNTFYSPALFDDSNNDAARDSSHFSRLCLVVLDDVDPATLEDLPPTYLIETSPNSFQAGYKLDEPIYDWDSANSLVTAVSGTKSDRSGNNAARYVRLPVGFHGKSGSPQKLVYIKPELTYTPEELRSFFETPDSITPAIKQGKWEGLAVEKQALNKNAAGKYTDGGRKEIIRRWQMSMASQGKTLEEMEALVSDFIAQFDETWTEEDTRNALLSGRGAYRKAQRTRPQDEPAPAPVAPDDLLEVPTSSALWPEHPWVWRPYFMRGSVVAINAPGGTGKSAFVAAVAAHGASMKPLGKTFDGRIKSVIVTYEDSSDVYMRRLDSFDGIKHDLIKENVRVVSANRIPAESHFWVERVGSSIQATGAASMLGDLLEGFAPDIVFLDTLSQLNGGDEDNATFAKIVKSASLLAEKLNCCVVLIHHTGKDVARAGIIDQYSGRGGSAVSDNARSVIQLINVDGETAKKIWKGKIFEVRDDQNVVAAVHVKSNYAMAAEPIAFVRVSVPRTHSYFLKVLDTSSLPDAPTAEEKKVAKAATDAAIALEWLRSQKMAVTPRMVRDMPATSKPAGLRGSLKGALDAAVEAGAIKLVEATMSNRKTQVYVFVEEE